MPRGPWVSVLTAVTAAGVFVWRSAPPDEPTTTTTDPSAADVRGMPLRHRDSDDQSVAPRVARVYPVRDLMEAYRPWGDAIRPPGSPWRTVDDRDALEGLVHLLMWAPVDATDSIGRATDYADGMLYVSMPAADHERLGHLLAFVRAGLAADRRRP